MKKAWLGSALLFTSVVALGAQSAPPLIEPVAAAEAVKARDLPPRIVQIFGTGPRAVLRPAEVAAAGELAALRAWNEQGRLPAKVGFTRDLAQAGLRVERVELDASLLDRPWSERAGGVAAALSFERVAWGTEVRVEGADALRLHLAGVRLPPEARLWVHGERGDVAGPFGPELVGPDGGLWTPSVAGEVARLELVLPSRSLQGGSRWGFEIDQVLEIVPPLGLPEEVVSTTEAQRFPCNVDGGCATRSELGFIDAYRRAVARLRWVSGGSAFLCTGALLNDTDERTTIPYLLTARHCIGSQAEASTLEAAWDYFSTSCGGPAPAFSQLPRSNGATLLASGAGSDFTLLRLHSVPRGRSYLGWTANPNAAPEGTLLHRLSHPGGTQQSYTVTRASTSVPACFGARPSYLYSTQVTGGTFGGSSGAPLVLAGGQVVGQLRGGCNHADDCSPEQYTVDGAFSATYPQIRQYLDPLKPCVPGPNTLCLLNGRFRAEVDWQNQFDGSAGVGRPVKRSDSTGFFYFFEPSNFELILKVLDFGDVVKVFYGQLTNLKFTLTLTDTRTGDVKRYQNGPDDCGALDQQAFAGLKSAAGSVLAASAPQTGTCRPGPDTLCLLSNRFRVEVDWRNQYNGSSGRGAAVGLSQQTGLFTFTDRTNVEIVAKALDFGDRVLFFYSTLSDLEYTITVTDTTTGAVKTYRNPAGNFCGGLDERAF
jgi:hypothetical protein